MTNRSFVSKTSQKGFTIVEIIISLAIAALVIVGVSFFVSRVNSDIESTKNRTQVHIDITAFIEKMNFIRTNFSSGSVVVSGTDQYNVVLFTNTGGTSGALIGVVDADNTNASGATFLDPSSAFGTYGNKVLGITELTKSQVQAIVTSTGAVYAIPFRANKIYSALPVMDFVANTYNSGTLLEIDTNVYEKYLEPAKGTLVSRVNTSDILPFHLIF